MSYSVLHVFTCDVKHTVPLKSKLSLEKQGFLEYAKTRKGFEETIYFSKKE